MSNSVPVHTDIHAADSHFKHETPRRGEIKWQFKNNLRGWNAAEVEVTAVNGDR